MPESENKPKTKASVDGPIGPPRPPKTKTGSGDESDKPHRKLINAEAAKNVAARFGGWQKIVDSNNDTDELYIAFEEIGIRRELLQSLLLMERLSPREQLIRRIAHHIFLEWVRFEERSKRNRNWSPESETWEQVLNRSLNCFSKKMNDFEIVPIDIKDEILGHPSRYNGAQIEWIET